MSSHYSSRIAPIGSNMSGSGYPFRGIYKVNEGINHGHGGQQGSPHKLNRAHPTRLDVYITGSNLAIRKLHTSDGTQVHNELAIDQSASRAVALEVNSPRMTALVVPDDGHEYKLITTLRHDKTKHVCRMTLRGQRAASPQERSPPQDKIDARTGVWLLGAPVGHDAPETEQLRRAVKIVADGAYVDVVDGQYAIPASAQNCYMELHKESLLNELSHPQQQMLQEPVSHRSAATSSFCPVWSPSTAQSVPIPPSEKQPTSGPSAPLTVETRVTKVAHAGTPGAVTPAALYYFTTSCPGYEVELTYTRSGAVVRGMSTASVDITAGTPSARALSPSPPTLGAHAQEEEAEVRVVVRHPDTHAVVLQQTQHVPIGNSASSAHTTTASAAAGTTATTTSVAAPDSPTLRAPNVNVSAALPIPSPLPSSLTEPSNRYDWVQPLAAALQASGVEEARERVREIHRAVHTAADAQGGCVVDFIQEQLNRPPPALDVLVDRVDGRVREVHCPGYAVEVTEQKNDEDKNSNNNTTSIHGESSTLLAHALTQAAVAAGVTRVHTNNVAKASRVTIMTRAHPPRPIASCLVRLGALDDGATADSAAHAAELLVQRLMDCIQQHEMDPVRVADALDAQRAGTTTSLGLRLLTALQSMLRRCTTAAPPAAVAAEEGIQFVCGHGVVENIYTPMPHLILSAHVDDAAWEGADPHAINGSREAHVRSLTQHGRLPASGAWPARATPYRITLFATDPHTQRIVHRTQVHILGAEDVRVSHGGERGAGGANVSSSMSMGNVPPLGNAYASHSHTTAAASDLGGSALYTAASSPAPPVYLDVSLQRMADTNFVRLLTRPELRLVCVIDGRGGDTGRSEHLTELAPQLPHHLELSVMNAQGCVLFQQKLDVPASGEAVTTAATEEPLVWGLAVQDGGLAVDPDVSRGAVTRLSVDRGAETVLQDHLARLDTSTSRHVILHRFRPSGGAARGTQHMGDHYTHDMRPGYYSENSGVPQSRAITDSAMTWVGTVRLRLPGFVGVRIISEIAALLADASDESAQEERVRTRLKELRRDYGAVTVVRELVTAALDLMHRTLSRETAHRSAAPSMSSQRELSSSSGSRVYFRLTGTDQS